jgi:hypothetical protein
MCNPKKPGIPRFRPHAAVNLIFKVLRIGANACFIYPPVSLRYEASIVGLSAGREEPEQDAPRS